MPRSSQTTMVWPPSAVSMTSMSCSSGSSASFDSHQQPLRGFARFHAAGARPATGEKVCAVLAAEAQVALDRPVPAGQTRGIAECRPDVVDIGVQAVFDAHDAFSLG